MAWDDSAETRAAAAAAGVKIAEPDSIDWSKITALVISPGIPNLLPKPHPVAAAARAAGVPLICDIDLLAQAEPKTRFVGDHRHQRQVDHDGADRPYPAQRRLRPRRSAAISARRRSISSRSGWAASMCWSCRPTSSSCVQTFHAHVAVWLNITPDHLDRHGDMEGYVAAKKHIFDRQDDARLRDDRHRRRVFRDIFRWLSKRRLAEDIAVVPMALKRTIAGGVYFQAGRLIDAEGYKVEFADVPTLPGDHNAQNAAAAWAAARWSACRARRSPPACAPIPACRTARSRSRRWATCVYVNDSKATNADATARALLVATTTSTGSSAARRRRAAWRRSRRTSSACARPS